MTISTAARPPRSIRPTIFRPATTQPVTVVRVAAVAAMATALVVGFVATGHEAATQVAWRDGPDLVHLLRGMALLKMLMAAAASLAVLWRLGSPSGPPWLAGYAVAALAMWAGPGLIWNLSYLRPGALLLHGGLFATLVLLWRDPVAGARLGAIVDARRGIIRAREQDAMVRGLPPGRCPGAAGAGGPKPHEFQ